LNKKSQKQQATGFEPLCHICILLPILFVHICTPADYKGLDLTSASLIFIN